MQRFTISIDDDLAQLFDDYLERYGYSNRSEAFRDLIRNLLAGLEVQNNPDAQCIGILSYAYNHHERQLAMRMTEHQHAHTEAVISTMHVHATHDECVESVVLRGTAIEVQAISQKLAVESGIRHGFLNLIPLPESKGESPYAHVNGSHHHEHEHPHHHHD